MSDRIPGPVATVELIRSGAITAFEHVERVLAAIDAHAKYGAWAFVDRSGALAAAARADQLQAAGGSLGPLHGVAIGIKDVIAVAGMPTRAGSRATDDEPAVADAAAVARLRAAGAVIVGKTTTHEFASGQGDPGTLNPRHLDRHPGGSSVGSAVAVGLGSVGATLGTDTSGSIRNPSAAHGVVGYKPSNGTVDTTGLLYFSDTLDTIGPIAPTVADCHLLYAVLSGAPQAGTAPSDTAVTGAAGQQWGPARPVRLAVAVDVLDSPLLDPGFRRVLEDSLNRLLQAGIELVECEAPAYKHGMTAALVIAAKEAAQHHAARLRSRAGDYLPESRRLIAAGALLTDTDDKLAREASYRLRDELKTSAATTGADALVNLTLPTPQPLLSKAVTSFTAQAADGSLTAAMQHLSLANLTGAPAISLPAGESDGHPVGLHLLGLRANDHNLLQAAARVERILSASSGV